MAKVLRKSTQERREEIVSAVLRIIAVKGLTSLTTATLAREIDVSTGALFRHFASWDEIFQETVRYALHRLDSTFPESGLPPHDRIHALAINRIRVVGSEPGLSWMLRSDQAYLTLPRDSVEDLKAMVLRSKRFVREALQEGIHLGIFRNDLPIDHLLVVVMGTIHALIGRSGLSHLASKTDQRNTEAVLSSLFSLLTLNSNSKEYP